MDQSQVGRAELSSRRSLKQSLQGARPERTRREPRDPLPRKRALELERHSRARLLAQRHQDTDGLLAQSTHRHLKHRDRRRVQPLDIIERHQHRPRLTERPEDVHERQPDRMRVRRLAVGFGEQQSHLECPPARGRERRRHTVQHPREQLGQARKGEHRLRLHTAPREHPAGAPARILASDLPQNRLPDPRLAGDDECGRSRSQLARETAGSRTSSSSRPTMAVVCMDEPILTAASEACHSLPCVSARRPPASPHVLSPCQRASRFGRVATARSVFAQAEAGTRRLARSGS